MRVPFRRRSKPGVEKLLAMAGAVSALRRVRRSRRRSWRRPGLLAAAGGLAAALAAGLVARRRKGDAEPLGEGPTVPDPHAVATPPPGQMAAAADMTEAVEGSDASTEAEETVNERRKE